MTCAFADMNNTSMPDISPCYHILASRLTYVKKRMACEAAIHLKREHQNTPPMTMKKKNVGAIGPEMPAQALLKPRSSPCSSPLGRGVALSRNVGPSTPYVFGPEAPEALLDEAEPKRCVSAASCCSPDNDVLFRSCSSMFARSSSWCKIAARRFGFKAHLSV